MSTRAGEVEPYSRTGYGLGGVPFDVDLAGAACMTADLELFAPRERGEQASMQMAERVAAAAAVCAGCPVKGPCIDAGRRYRGSGVYGGVLLDRGRPVQLPQVRERPARKIAHRETCGTYAAYKRHRRHGEEPDEACVDAFQTYQRDAYRRSRERSAVA